MGEQKDVFEALFDDTVRHRQVRCAESASLFDFLRSEIDGMNGFFQKFGLGKSGDHVIKICQADACQAKSAATLTEHAKARLGLEFHETDGDGLVRLEPVDCLGYCHCGPAIKIDKKILGRVTEERFDKLVDSLIGEKVNTAGDKVNVTGGDN